MDITPVVLVVALGGALTYLIRLSFLFLLGSQAITPIVQDVLRYIPAAAFAAIVLPAVLVRDGAVEASWHNLPLLAAAAALAVGLKTRSVLPVLATGMITLWLLRYLVG